jgi:hypothetical protein
MPLFKRGKCLEAIKEKPFRLEREIQDITEENLQRIFRINFIRSEFPINNFRIDSLAQWHMTMKQIHLS